MANRRMTKAEIAAAMTVLDGARAQLATLSAGDPELLFAMRRRVYVRLMYDERETPAHRTKLKAAKWIEQDGLCGICGKPMPQKRSELDRKKASAGYTPENTRLVHHECHGQDQASKGFNDAPDEPAELP